MERILEIGGWVGVILLLLGYALLSTKRLKFPQTYHCYVMVGCLLVAAQQAFLGVWSVFVFNLTSVLLALYALWQERKSYERRNTH